MRFRTFIIAILAIALGLHSCITSGEHNRIVKVYFGPERLKDSLAFIERGELPSERGELPKSHMEYNLIFQVDSIKVASGKIGFSPMRCDILPGTHTIEVFHRMYPKYIIGRYLVTFDAEAGKTYRIYSNTDLLKRELDVYVVDVNSGQRVPSTVTHRFTIRGKE